jgi:predicted nucleic acid-binding protein
MVLVDASVWVDHFRQGNIGLIDLLNEGQVVSHPFIIGELACGNLKNRSQILSLLSTLPTALVVEHEEMMGFIENHRLMGKGLGFIDVHLLASAMLTNVPLWTLDKRLNSTSAALGLKLS